LGETGRELAISLAFSGFAGLVRDKKRGEKRHGA